MTDLSRLEELAIAATRPGAEQPHITAAYVKACDPQTILSLIERLRAAEERGAKREHAVFEQGWRVAASWSDRTDLFFDTDSPAYAKDRQAALAMLDQAEAARVHNYCTV